MTDVTRESLAAALEELLLASMRYRDRKGAVREDDVAALAGAQAQAREALAALPGPAPEPPPWPDMRPDYQRIADAVSTCGSIREAVAWIEEEARRDLRAAQPAPDLDVERLLRAWTTHRIRSQHGQDGHPECGPTRCVEAIANTYRHTLMPFQARESGGEP